MHITDIDSNIPERSRSYACKFPIEGGGGGLAIDLFHNGGSFIYSFICI